MDDYYYYVNRLSGWIWGEKSGAIRAGVWVEKSENSPL